MTAVVTSRQLGAALAELGADGSLVGASIAVGTDGVIETAAVGETRYGSGLLMSARTVLQIGSITKLYTATMVMQLARDGKVDLDSPFRTYVPELVPHDRERADHITVRHLLSHTSGLQADFVVDTGRGDDCLAAFVDHCSAAAQGPVGERYEYCNTGYVLLGRLVEKMTDRIWDDALADMILAPANLVETMTLPEQVLLHDNAVGHFPQQRDGAASWTPAPVWSVPRVGGPAGTICATAADVVRFAECHLATADDTLLPVASRVAMQTPQVAVPGSEVDERCALGWHLRRYGGRELLGHTGGNMGQGGMLWLDPAGGRVVCLLVNGLLDMALFDAVLNRTLSSPADVGSRPTT